MLLRLPCIRQRQMHEIIVIKIEESLNFVVRIKLLGICSIIDLIHLILLIRDIDIIFLSMTCSRNVSSYFVAKIYTRVLLFQYVYFAVSTEVTLNKYVY